MSALVHTGIRYIDVKEFTDNVLINESNEYYPVTGDGIFDELMETATKHLLAQYKTNRIRGENFASIYAHVYEVTLQAALQAWIQKPEVAARCELINAQTEHEYAKLKNTKADTLAKLLGLKLIKAQIENAKADTALKRIQIENAKAEIKLKEQQAKNSAAETLLKLAQIKFVKAQTKAANKDEAVKEAQINSENMKSNLYQRQIEGYDENYKEKILKILLDAFTVVFSVASEGFKGGLPKVLTVSGINDLSDIITNDLNIPRTKATISAMTNTSNTTPSNNPLSDHHNTTIPDSYTTYESDES